MTRSTEAHVRIAVEKVVEKLLDRWATGDTRAQTEKYLHKLALTAQNLRREADAIDELIAQERGK
jgi:acyl-CoA reductase-like NAD-dependent aldehyde dehydrogenase